jgi:hypothetical protein
MSTRIHLCVSVRGMLNWSVYETRRQLKSITKEDGSRFSGVGEFRNYLMDELAAVHEVLPTVKDFGRSSKSPLAPSGSSIDHKPPARGEEGSL